MDWLLGEASDPFEQQLQQMAGSEAGNNTPLPGWQQGMDMELPVQQQSATAQPSQDLWVVLPQQVVVQQAPHLLLEPEAVVASCNLPASSFASPGGSS